MNIKNLVGVSLFVAATGCAIDDGELDVGEADQEVVGGQVVQPEANGYVNMSVGCTGTLMTNDLVLTAKHCFSAANVANPTAVGVSMGALFRSAVEIELYPNDDVALVRVDSPLPMNGSTTGFERRLYPLRTNTLQPNTMLTCFGYGETTWNAKTEDGNLRRVQLPVRGVNFTWWFQHYDLGVNANTFGEFLAHGDSGGSCLAQMPNGEMVLAGVQSTTYVQADGTFMGQVDPDQFRGWYQALRTTHEMVSQATSKCADGSFQRTCNDGSSQRWRIVPRENGYYELRGTNNGLCFRANSGNSISFGTCNVDMNSLWNLDAAGGDFYQLRNASNNQCLDIPSGSSAEGLGLQTFTCNGGSNQHWRFDARFAPRAFQTLTPSNAPGSTCMSIASGSTGSGAQMFMQPCTGTDEQQITFIQVSGDEHAAQMRHSSACFDLPFASTADNVQLQQWGCVFGASNQEVHARWHNGTYTLRLANSDKCISAAGNANTGTPVVQEWCGANGFQQNWYLY